MCGIVAILSREKNFHAENLTASVRTLRGRGPDREDFWIDENGTIGLAHARLSVIDLVSSNQPLHSKNGFLHAVVNGEFYDFERQRKELSNEGFEFQTMGDSEIILPLYQKFGTEAVHRLRGEFAFVLWDEANQTLVAARDRFGIKPLFYVEHEGKLLLASEAKALFAAGIPARWDEESVYQQMFFYPDQDRTLFAKIKQVPAGCLLIATRNNFRIQRYWDLDFPLQTQESHGKFEEKETIEQLRKQIDEAVRLRLRADVEVASFLSGGLDSSAILGLAAKHSAKKIRAFTIGFGEEGFDESGIASETAQSVGAEFNLIKVNFADIADNLGAAVTQAETLGVNWHGVARYLLSREVKKAGIRVALTGEGADEVFAGYLQFKQDFEQVPDFNGDAEKTEQFKFIRRVLGFVPAWIRKLSGGRAPLNLLLTKDFSRRFENYDVFRNFLTQFDVRGQLSERDSLRQSQYLWTRSILPNYTLFAERLEAGNGVETRVPFLDHHLFELARELPANLLIREMQEKYALREAVRPVLTETVYARAKHPFLAPPATTDAKNPLYVLINDTLRGKMADDVPFIDKKAAVAILDKLPNLPQAAQIALDAALAMMVCACFLQANFAEWNSIKNEKFLQGGAGL